MKLRTSVAGVLAEQAEGLVDADAERAREDALCLFDHDSRLERRLQLRHPLQEKVV